jgi:hypothetical protein
MLTRLPQKPHPAVKLEVIFCVRGVISPLLANIYLHLLDRLWAAKCGSLGVLIRYADDFVVMTTTESKAKEALRQIQFVMNKLGLVLHPEKTRMVELRRGKGSFVFLGCTIRKKRSILRNPRWYFMHRWPSPKATKFSPPEAEFNETQKEYEKEYDEACAWAKDLSARLNHLDRWSVIDLDSLPKPPPAMQESNIPKVEQEIFDDFKLHNEIARRRQALLIAQKRSGSEENLVILAPLFAVVALALRLTKVTGEIRLG